MSRPKRKLDADIIKQLATIGCTTETIAKHLQCSRDTLERRFRRELDSGKSSGQVRILNRIFQAALAGQPRAMELAAVNICHWKLRPEVTVNVLQTGGQSPDEVRGTLLALREAVRSEALREAVTPIEVEVVRGGVSINGNGNEKDQSHHCLPAG
jgi:hypothetical protein